jgi:hypothetical protein
MGFRRILTVAALAMTSSIITFSAVPAQAQVPNPVCGDQVQVIDGPNGFTKTGPSASVVYDMDGGVIVETKVNDDSLQWKKTFASPLPLPGMYFSYRTKKLDDGLTNAAALPAYRIFLTGTDGPNSSTTLVFEPYYQISGNPALGMYVTWTIDANSKFWVTKTIAGITAEGGGSYAGNKTLAQIMVANPAAKIAAIAIGQGTYNAGTRAWVGAVRIGCARYVWRQPVKSPSASASTSASASASAGASPGVSVSTSAVSLPLTSSDHDVSGIVYVGLGTITLGLLFLALWWQSKRRSRVRFVA